MDVETKSDEYVELYKKVKARVGTDEIAAVILEQVGKDGRVAVMNGNGAATNVNEDGEPLASEKQIRYLRNLGVQVDDKVTRREASDLIDKATEGR